MKRWMKTCVALVALVAMLMENTYSVYAAMDGYTPSEEVVAEETPIEVVAEPQEVQAEEAPAEIVSEEVTPDVGGEPTDFVEEAVTDEYATDEYVEMDENTDLSAGVISASIDAYDNMLAFTGTEWTTLYINTDQMNESDHFKLNWTETVIPEMDNVLFDYMTKSNGGIYDITGLNGEYFELWVSTISEGMEVFYEVRPEDGYPQITLVSAPEEEIEKILTVDGNSVYGQGYTELHIGINTAELPDDTYYQLHIDSSAYVAYEGSTLSDNTIYSISNAINDIYLSDLDKSEFYLYVTGESTDEIGVEYFIDSVENGALTLAINMNGIEEELEGEEVEEDLPIITLKASVVDEFGDAISEEYSDIELPEFDNDVLTLNDVDNPPVANVEIKNGASKVIKYTYSRATIDGTVISSITRKEVTDEETGETGYSYSYMTGEEETVLTEDTTVNFEYSDGKKSVYTYEDSEISVTATLQHANAIPDDAEFVVTKITPETSGYNYDAYMQAANDNAAILDPEHAETEEEVFTEENTMLFDIAFMCADENGNMVEYQPAEGMVKIVIDFKANQLSSDSEGIDAEESAEVIIAHLPLSEAVQESVDSTAEATNISASDIIVEPVSNQSSADGEEVEFNLSDFSVILYKKVSDSEFKPGTSRDFKSILGNAVNYGIVANKIKLEAHMASNFATKELNVPQNDHWVTAGTFTNNNGGNYIIADVKGNGHFGVDGAATRIKTWIQSKWHFEDWNFYKKDNEIFDYYNDNSGLKSEVTNLINGVNSAGIVENETLFDYKALMVGNNLDISSKPAGTYYISADSNLFNTTGGDLNIIKNSNQTIVFNFTENTPTFKRFEVKDKDTGEYMKVSENDTMAQQNARLVEHFASTLVFNAPNATELKFDSGVVGTFIAPRASVNGLNGCCAGWIVCDYFYNGGSEWHCVYGDMPPGDTPDPCQGQIVATKTVNGLKPGTMEKFTFQLWSYDWNTKEYTLIQEKQNDNDGKVTFDPITYDSVPDNKHTFAYKVVEAEADDGYEHDTVSYVVHHKVEKNGTKYEIYETKIYYGDGKPFVGNSNDVIKFDNKKQITYDISVKKYFGSWKFNDAASIVEGEWPEGVSVECTLKPFDGGWANIGAGIECPGPMPKGSTGEGANASKTVILTKDNSEASFGNLVFSPDKGNSNPNSKPWQRTKVAYHTYMYTITEKLLPENLPAGVKQAEDATRYVKLFVNTYQETDGSYTVEIEPHESEINNNNIEGRHCQPHKPGPYIFVNKYDPSSLTVNKVVKDKSGNTASSDDTFYVIVYKETGYSKTRTYYGVDGTEYQSVHVEPIDGNSSIVFKPIETDTTYYVVETDKDGNPVKTSDKFEYTTVYTGLESSNSVSLKGSGANKEVTITNTQSERGKITLTKKGGLGNENPASLSGVTFLLKRLDGSNNGDGSPVYVSTTVNGNGAYTAQDSQGGNTAIVTGANGSFSVDNLKYGNYSLTEVSLPEAISGAYIKYSSPILFTVDENGTRLTSSDATHVSGTQNSFELDMTLYNERAKVALKIEKSIKNATGKTLDGFKFKLKDNTTGKYVNDGATTNSDGIATFTDLVFGHTYVIEEDATAAADKGYVLKGITPSEFTVDNSLFNSNSIDTEVIGTTTYVVVNSKAENVYVTGKVKLIKKDADNNKITEGSAKFVLSTSKEIADTTKYVSVTGSNGAYSYDASGSITTLETASGVLTVDNLAPGKYYFFETESPDENLYTFISGTAYEFEIKASDASADDPVVVAGDVIVTNGSFKASLEFGKVDAADSTKVLNGVKFDLYETVNGSKSGDKLGTSTSDSNGMVTVSFSKAGTYVLEESSPAEGYTNNYGNAPLSIYFTVTPDMDGAGSDGKAILTLSDVRATTSQSSRNGDNLINGNNVLNDSNYGEVTLNKVFKDKNGNTITSDSDAAKADLLGEAQFELYTNSIEYKTKEKRTQYDFIQYMESPAVNGLFTTSGQSLHIENLPWGTYYFVEKATVEKDGNDVYTYDSDTKYYFTIGKDTNGTVNLSADSFKLKNETKVDSITNTIKTGSVTITKQDSKTDKAIEGIKFELHRAVMGEGGSVATEIATIDTYETDGNGEISVTGLEFGTYYFVECAESEQTVKGYNFDSTTKYWFDIDNSNSAEELVYYVDGNKKDSDCVITNEPILGKVKLDKWAISAGTRDSASDDKYLEKLSGATFKLYSNKPSTGLQQAASWLKNLLGTDESFYEYGEYTTVDGSLSVDELPWGNYYFVETKAPVGYVSIDEIDEADRTFRFTIDADNLEVSIVRPDAENGITNDELDGKVPMNEQLTGSIKLTKTDFVTGKAIKGVAFRLFKDDNDYTGSLTNYNSLNLGYSQDNVEEMLLITNDEGVIEVTGLPWGTYYFKEDKVPTGYTADSTNLESAKVTISADNVSALSTFGDKNSLTMTNIPIVGELFLSKVDEKGSALVGATFDLVRVDSATAPTEYHKVKLTGSVGNYTCDLNDPFESTDYLGGGTFADKLKSFWNNITGNNTASGSLVTSGSGTLSITNLPYGDYQIYEVSAPEGYESGSENVKLYRSFTIDGTDNENGHDGEVVFENSKINAGVQFVKTVGDKALAGVSFKLQKKDGENWTDVDGATATATQGVYYKPDDSSNTEVGTFDSVVTFVGFPVGNYRIYEYGPEGYAYQNNNSKQIGPDAGADTEYYYFDITQADQGVLNVGLINKDSETFNNFNVQTVNNKEREGKAELTKVNVSNDVINGAEFDLYYEANNDGIHELGTPSDDIVAQSGITSNDSGIVSTNSLKWGDYYLVETKTSDATYYLESDIDKRPQYHFTIGANSDNTFTEIVREFTVLQKGVNGSYVAINAVNEKFYGKLDLEKRDSVTEKLIESADVKFELYYKASEKGDYAKVDSYSGENAITAEDGHIRAEKLEAGWYRLVEISTAAGYKTPATDNYYEFTISQGDKKGEGKLTWITILPEKDGNEYIANEPMPGSIELFKYYVLTDSDEKIALSGAKFKLTGKTDAGKSYESTEVTSDTEGKVKFENVPWGTYDVVEVSVPAGYEIPGGVSLPKDIVISAAKRDYSFEKDESLTIRNDRLLGSLKIKKVDSKSNEGLAGVGFELQRWNEKTNNWDKIINPEDSEGLYRTGEGGLLNVLKGDTRKGEAVIVGLKWGKYRLIEKVVPEGYEPLSHAVPSDNGIEINGDNVNVDLTKDEKDIITNNPVHGNIELTKTDNNNRPLKGAKFNLYQKVGDNSTAILVYVVDGGNGVYSYDTMDASKKAANATDTLISPDGGKIKVTGLPYGTYFMKEVGAPDPTTDDGQTQIYAINAGDIGPFEVVTDQTADAAPIGDNNSREWINTPGGFAAHVIFSKTDGNSNGLKGVTYTIAPVGNANASWTVTSGDEGAVKIDFTAIGEYILKEASAPNNAYELDGNTYIITITEADKDKIIKLSECITVPENATDSKFDSTNNSFANNEIKGSVKLVKYETAHDSEAEIGRLNGVSFKLYKGSVVDDNLYVTEKNATGIYTTGRVGSEDGVIKVTDLPWGDYVFVEESAPEGYEIDGGQYSFTISAETFAKKEQIEVGKVRNKRKPGSLTVQKIFENPETDFDGTGVEFTLTSVAKDNDNKPLYVYTKSTTKDDKGNYYVEFTNLPWGDYVLTEGEPKEGYKSYTDSKSVTIDAQNIDVKLVGDNGIKNEKIKGSVIIQKVDSVTNKGIEDVAFKLYKGDTPATIGTTTTGKTPVIIKGFDDGVGTIDFTDENGIFKTGNDGMVTFPLKSLEYGHYYLEEAVPEGYLGSATVDDTNNTLVFTYQGVEFDITSEIPVSLTRNDKKPIVNEPAYGEVTIKKTDGKLPMKGVTFKLYADEAQGAGAVDMFKSAWNTLLNKLGFDKQVGTVYREFTINDENGTFTLKGLPRGKYHFEEILPDGYTQTSEQKAEIEKPFVIGSQEDGSNKFTFSFEFKNTPKKGSVELMKTGWDKITNVNVSLAGAKFDLYKINGKMDAVAGASLADGDAGLDTKVNTEHLVTGEGENLGKIKVDDLDWGQYYFVEVEPPKGYDLSTKTPQILTVGRPVDGTYVDASNSATFVLNPSTTVVNTKGYGYTALYKVFDLIGMDGLDTSVEKNGTYLTFAVYKAVDGKVTGDPIEFTVGDKKVSQFNVNRNMMTDVIGPMEYGEYAFVEMSVPEGVDYKVDKTPLFFTIDKDCTKDAVENEINELASGADGHTFTYVKKYINTIYRGSASIGKVDATDNSKVSNIEFDVYEVTESGNIVTLGSIYTTATTNANGTATAEGLPLGTYAFKEKAKAAAGLGYDATKNIFVFSITEENVKNENVANPEIKVATPNDNGTYTLGAALNGAVSNERILGSLKLKKTGKNGVALDGAQFKLYKVEGIRDEIPGVSAIGDTSIDSVIKVTNGYASETGEEILTTVDGEILVKGLDWGTYYFDEIEPPKGYKSPDRPNPSNPSEVTINGSNADPEDPVTITMSNDTVRIDISKTDINGNGEIPGATMAIYGAEGTELIKWVSTSSSKRIEIGEKGSNGKEFAGLITSKDGEAPVIYRLAELDAPAGYTAIDDIYFSVDTKGKVTLYVDADGNELDATVADTTLVDANGNELSAPRLRVKDAKTSIQISKRELGTDRDLQGAKLAIYTEKGYASENPVGEDIIDSWTSNSASDTAAHTIAGKLTVSTDDNKVYYYLVEKEAPEGYYVADPVKFYVDNENVIHIVEAEGSSALTIDDGKHLVMYDRPIYVLINKKATDGTKNLSGATLQVVDDMTPPYINKEIKTSEKPALLVPVTEAEAASTPATAAKYSELAKSYDVVYGVKLSEGVTYTLTETEAPKGYKKAESQTFKVSEKSSAFDATLGLYATTVLDAPIELVVSKKGIVGDEELSGATLSVYEKEDYDKSPEAAEPVTTWISGGEEHIVSVSNSENVGVLELGKSYYLVEDTAPAGYDIATKTEFTVTADGKIETGETESINGKNVPKITVNDQALMLAVNKEDSDKKALSGASLELRDSDKEDAKVLASWTSNGTTAFLSQYASVPTGYTKIDLNEGAELIAGKTYYVVETAAPTGYDKAQPLPVEAKSTLNTATYTVVNGRSGEVKLGGTKSWKLDPNKLDELKGESININLYRYVDISGIKYVDKDGKIADKADALIATQSISVSDKSTQYMFGGGENNKLDKYYYDDKGEAYEYTYEVEEDLNDLDEYFVSEKIENDDGSVDFVNYQQYTEIKGDKTWILVKDEDKNVVTDFFNDPLLKAVLGITNKTETAYADVEIYLATIVDGEPVMIDEDGDKVADYSVTIKNGALYSDSLESHDTKTNDGKNHVEIEWNDPGEVDFGFINLPMYDTKTGEKIEYAFVEKAVIDGKTEFRVIYNKETGNNYGTNGVSITNIPVIDPFNIKGTKNWVDPEGTKRPTVAIQLYRDGRSMGPDYRVELSEANGYNFEFKNLPVLDIEETGDAHKYVYELKEEGASGLYDIQVDFDGIPTRISNVLEAPAEITNSIKSKEIEISGTKTWKNSAQALRPTVTFNLYATDSTRTHEFVASRTMSNTSSSTYRFDHLPMYDNSGEIIKYSVEEDMSNLGGYKSTPADGYTITPVPGTIFYSGYDFTNEPSIIRVRKVDMTTGARLSGATLQVVDVSTGRVVDTWISTTGDHYIEGLTLGGNYRLEEVNPPAGFEAAPAKAFTVNPIPSDQLITMEDPRITGSVTLTKRDASTRDVLSGAVFNLYTSGGTLVRATGSSGSYTYSSDSAASTALAVSSAGALTVSGLPYGTYYFKEITPPTGYDLSSALEYFTIYEGGSSVDVTFLDERSTGAVYLRKVAAGTSTPLAGAVFELYSSTPRTPGQAAASTFYSDAYYRYGTYTTGSDGMLYVSGLPWDSYYFIEVAAPTGYVSNTDVNGDPLVYTFIVDAGSASSIGIDMGTIENPREEGGGGGGGGSTGGTTGGTTGGGGGGSGVAGVRRAGGVLSGVLGVRAKPTSGVLGARVGPVTADMGNILLWLLLLIASASVILVICIQNHKRKKAAK